MSKQCHFILHGAQLIRNAKQFVFHIKIEIVFHETVSNGMETFKSDPLCNKKI